jgi:hypothetical protein
LQNNITRLATASDKVCQLLAHGQWFSLDTPPLPPLQLVANKSLKQY